MVRTGVTMLLAIALAGTLIVTGSAPLLAAQGGSRACSVKGVVSSVRTERSSFTMKTAGTPSKSVDVWVQSFTTITLREGDATHRAALRDLRAGDLIAVEGVCLDDGRVLAMSAAAQPRAARGPNREGAVGSAGSGASASAGSGSSGSGSALGAPGSASGPAAPAAASNPAAGASSAARSAASSQVPGSSTPMHVEGVVTAKPSPNLLVLADTNGGRRQIILTGDTDVTGGRSSASAISRLDFLKVDGTAGQNGSVVATDVNVARAANNLITGKITAKGQDSLVLDGNTIVRITPNTMIMAGGTLQPASSLKVGDTITVSGTVNGNTETVGGGSGGGGSGAGGATANAMREVIASVIGLVGP